MTTITAPTSYRCFNVGGKGILVNMDHVVCIKPIDGCEASELSFVNGSYIVVDENISTIENSITNANPY